jgi:hypothetical protein
LIGRLRRRWQEANAVLVALVVAGVVVAVRLPGDVPLYQSYARAALRTPLLHSFPKEYPALSLAVFLLPQLVPSAYVAAFALMAAGAAVLVVLSSDGLRDHPGWSWRTCTYLLLGSVAVVFARFDVFPVLAAVLAVEGARRRRWGRAWTWAVAGGLLKLFPFLLLPGFLLLERVQTGKWALRRVLAAATPVAALVAAQSLLAPGSATSPLRYELRRGFELSSLQGSLAFLVDPFHAHWVDAFDNREILGPGHDVIAATVTAAAVLALAGIWFLAGQGRLSVEAVSLATLSVAVLGDKAFAAQYLIWLVPLWAFWPLRRGWVAAAALTTLIYPLLYAEASWFGPGYFLATAAAVARNTVLVVATVLWFREQLAGYRALGRRSAAPVAAGGSAPGPAPAPVSPVSAPVH